MTTKGVNMMDGFIESINQGNDSSNFDGSFEIKNILSPNHHQLMRHRCVTELDRDKLEKFVLKLQQQQQENVTTPKNSPYLYRKAKAWIVGRGGGGTPELQRNSLPERGSYRSAAKMLQFFSKKIKSPEESQNNSNNISRSSTPLMYKLSDDDEEEEEEDDGIASLDSASSENTTNHTNGSGTDSPDSSCFLELHPPLVPTFKVTPPSATRRNPAYEFARFLRGSFHAKRAAITTLRRSISDSQRLNDIDFTKPIEATKKKSLTIKTMTLQQRILIDKTNHQTIKSHTMRVSHF